MTWINQQREDLRIYLKSWKDRRSPKNTNWGYLPWRSKCALRSKFWILQRNFMWTSFSNFLKLWSILRLPYWALIWNKNYIWKYLLLLKGFTHKSWVLSKESFWSCLRTPNNIIPWFLFPYFWILNLWKTDRNEKHTLNTQTLITHHLISPEIRFLVSKIQIISHLI